MSLSFEKDLSQLATEMGRVRRRRYAMHAAGNVSIFQEKIPIFRISRGSYVPRGARHENGQMPNGKVGHDDEDDLIFQFG